MAPSGSLLARTSRLFIILSLLALLALNLLPGVTRPAAPSLAAYSAPSTSGGSLPFVAIEGWITDKASKVGLPGATVLLDGKVSSRANSQGYFSFSRADLRAAGVSASAAGKAVFVDVTVRAIGYQDWALQRAAYYSEDTLRLYPSLDARSKAPVRLVAALARSRDRRLASDEQPQKNRAANTQSYSVERVAVSMNPPATIRVYRTGTGQVEVVPFRDYLKRTLPNEWIPTWGAESLKAGAMAVKTYAWYWISVGGKYGAQGADVRDNVDDQVYDPNVSYASTDAAVDATFQYVLTRNGSLFQTQYCAGSYSGEQTGSCPWGGSYMTQWGSAYYADRGKPWGWIVQFYYTGSVITPNPPGGGYDGGPVPTPAGQPTQAPTALPQPNFTVGQGSPRRDLFQAAYDRNGGAQVLGTPTGPVRWWLQYVSENNVAAQPLSGPDGRGNIWLVYDTLKSASSGVQRAYVLLGDIGGAYSTHNPPGPEWVGAPTSDPFVLNGQPSQGFAKGLLSGSGANIRFTPWPTQFTGWKSEYFAGRPSLSVQAGFPAALPGQPALILDQPSPGFSWAAADRISQAHGVGSADWAGQFTRQVTVLPGSYDFTLSANSGVLLWIDGVLAVNGWTWSSLQSTSYSADLDGSLHTIRIQYFNVGGDAQLSFDMASRGAAPSPGPAAQPPAQRVPGSGNAAARITVNWLGRQPPPSASWAQPLTLYLSVPGNPAIIGTYRSTTDQNGVAFYDGLPAGTFDVHVKGPHSLQTARAGITFSAGSTTDIDMKSQIEGDVNGDNCVTVQDFSVVQSMLGTNSATPGFNPAADLNGDGEVTMADVSLLRSGFDQCGDISADNQFSAMSTNGAPTLSQKLAPWTDPYALQRDLSYELVPSARSVRIGQTVDVQVVANVGSQPIDGASFILKFDPRALALVASNGGLASGAEPGLLLPSVMGNWADQAGGGVGYYAGALQSDLPTGKVVVATLRFRAVGLASTSTSIAFGPMPSGYMELTNGGANLLSTASDLSLAVQP